MGIRTGRPPLTERRKAATRLEIARAAVELFTTKGAAATTADEIAAAAGISVRTLWRYFPTKERCVVPIFATGIENVAHALRTWPRGQGMDVLIDEIRRHSRGTLPDAATFLALIRAARSDPALRSVWLQTNDDAEPLFAAALAERAGQPADSLPIHVQAAIIDTALRTAIEYYAWHIEDSGASDAGEGLIKAIRTALCTAADGLG